MSDNKVSMSAFCDCLGKVHSFQLDNITHEDLIKICNIGYAAATELRLLDEGYTSDEGWVKQKLENIIEGRHG